MKNILTLVIIINLLFSQITISKDSLIAYSDFDGEASISFLTYNDSIIDTIITNFGIKDIGNGYYAYQKASLNKLKKALKLWKSYNYTYSPIAYSLSNGLERIHLKTYISLYSDIFSSASNHKEFILMWGVEYIETEMISNIYAVSFNYLTKKVNSVFLFKQALETDYNSFFSAPTPINNVILFKSTFADYEVNFNDFTFQKVD